MLDSSFILFLCSFNLFSVGCFTISFILLCVAVSCGEINFIYQAFTSQCC